MQLKINGADFSTETARESFVKFLAGTVAGAGGCIFNAHTPNDNDTRYWVFDQGNDWRVVFSDAEKNVIDIHYRNQCDSVKAEEALAAWLVFRLASPQHAGVLPAPPGRHYTIPGEDFATPKARQSFVTFLAGMIAGDQSRDFEPYQQTANDDRTWVLDRGNTWFALFPAAAPGVIELRYKYATDEVPAEQSLGAWLMYRLRAIRPVFAGAVTVASAGA